MRLIVLGAIASVPTQQPGSPADSILPRFRADVVHVEGDTVWFLTTEPGEGVVEHPVLAYVAPKRQWIVTRRPWRLVQPLMESQSRSGWVEVTDIQPLGADYWLVHGQSCLHWTWSCATVRRPVGPPVPLNSALPADTRRRINQALEAMALPALTGTAIGEWPQRWARGSGTIAFVYDGDESLRYRESDAPIEYVSGLLVIDSVTGRATPLVHSAHLFEQWLDLEIAGTALFAVPRLDVDALDDDQTVRLLRYDIPSGHWREYRPRDLPTGSAAIRGIASDDGRLFVATEDGVAVLDLPTARWETRFYADLWVSLPDGADTVMTLLTTRPPSRVRIDTLPWDEQVREDSARTVETFANLLGPRHHRAFADAVARLVPHDTIGMIVGLESYDERGRDQEPTEFNSSAELAGVVLGRREFLPFLREAVWKTRTQDFALNTVARFGEAEVRSALRAALDSATKPAAVRAAGRLIDLGDPLGSIWLRGQLPEPGAPLELRGLTYGDDIWPPSWRALIILAQKNDTASIPAMMALLPAPVSESDRDRQSKVLWLLLEFPSAEARQRIARAVEERPWLWSDYLSLYYTHARLKDDAGIEAIVRRIEANRR
jgi:hypothetical protein